MANAGERRDLTIVAASLRYNAAVLTDHGRTDMAKTLAAYARRLESELRAEHGGILALDERFDYPDERAG